MRVLVPSPPSSKRCLDLKERGNGADRLICPDDAKQVHGSNSSKPRLFRDDVRSGHIVEKRRRGGHGPPRLPEEGCTAALALDSHC